MESIYGIYQDRLAQVAEDLKKRIEEIGERKKQELGYPVYEHLRVRVKDEKSMVEKCGRREVPVTTHAALRSIQDSVGIRIVTGYIDDIWMFAEEIRKMPGCTVVLEKDYIHHAKPNGYRSYHMIIELSEPFEDVLGRNPGGYFAEVQLRTIAMDSWASLEHEMKYKKKVHGSELIISELKRVADELASCDISMQTIRNLIRASGGNES